MNSAGPSRAISRASLPGSSSAMMRNVAAHASGRPQMSDGSSKRGLCAECSSRSRRGVNGCRSTLPPPASARGNPGARAAAVSRCRRTGRFRTARSSGPGQSRSAQPGQESARHRTRHPSTWSDSWRRKPSTRRRRALPRLPQCLDSGTAKKGVQFLPEEHRGVWNPPQPPRVPDRRRLHNSSSILPSR